jgi:PAS domain S-box-containing protein
MKDRRTLQELETELKATQLRLEEAEEILWAIRNNEVDALVIDGPRGQQVFTLQGAEQPYRIFMETMSEGALTVAFDGTILFCNQRFAEMLRAPLDRIMGSSFQQIMPSEDWQAFKPLLDTCEEGGCRGEYHFTTFEGREIPVYVSARSLRLQDVEGFCIVATDLTEQRTLEQQIRQTQKMEALGTFAGGIAHDFNNILAAMIGFTELAKDRALKGSRPEHYLQRVLEAGLRGRELVKQMLTFSRKTEQEKEPLQLSNVVKEAMKLLRPSIPSTISISVKADSESGLILADPTQMQQVLMNLCANAAHAMQEKGGILAVTLSDYSVSPSNGSDGMKPGLYMRLVVRDTGVGIPADIMDQVFDPFFTTKKPGVGTGLGLSVVEGIVKQHDGYITVESEHGRGTTFTVYFPNVAEQPKVKTASEGSVLTGHERVLFIDDEEALAEMGSEILRDLGYQVISKTNAREALALVRLDPMQFDLIITDQTMPEFTGIELAKKILTLRADLPIILCTGFSHLVNADSANAAGIRAFAMKPFTKREIARTIRDVLDAQPSVVQPSSGNP